jgi:DNA-binding NarL/FixJ family response regulator
MAARILVVEDDYLVALQAEAALTDAGFEVVGVAASADEAVTLAARERPTIALMDIRLAGERDGIDAAVEIFRNSGIRSIFATAHTDARTRSRAAAAEPLGWLPKPYSPESLVEIARQAVARVTAAH